ncbi:hypothetical protein Mal52_61730 [Symmachiella dynata]|uniref:DUF1501 domain-containing protein n=2 Tax=Symmachiella dynata TaxID=2527995 RepID=A0A517ZYV5_9PLAN|nr:hypothetical protein Mal52_61730 [Symmachiella dynata]
MPQSHSSDSPPTGGDSVSRRDVLKLGSAGILGMSTAEQAALRAEDQRAANRDIDGCIFIVLTGGPSQLDTFDPKPAAPTQIRGPFQAIATNTPGIQLSETLPRLAQRTHQFALLRSLHHTAAPIHEAGLQLLQTGRCARGGIMFPALGSMIDALLGPREGVPSYCVVPQLLGNTGIRTYQGQTAGILGTAHDPVTDSGYESALQKTSSQPYGTTPFARACFQARQLIEAGVRFVTVNMFLDLDQHKSWDCHGTITTMSDLRDTVCPDFDKTVSSLLDDLEATGLLKRTLVVASGEFGRTPRINSHGGRDHWPGVWSALMAGGPVSGGRVIGASDARGTAPIDSPVTPDALLSTIAAAFGIPQATTLTAPDDTEFSIATSRPISELGKARV